jgi:hypothetical protein
MSEDSAVTTASAGSSRTRRAFALAAAVVALSACGGGGGGGGSPPPVPPRPTFRADLTAVTVTDRRFDETVTLSGLPVSGATVTLDP